jgi:hypothetical protein
MKKKKKVVEKATDTTKTWYPEIISDPYQNIPYFTPNYNNYQLPQRTGDSLVDFQNNFDYYYIGNCTGDFDPLSGTSLSTLSPHQIIQIQNNLTGMIDCYSVETVYKKWKNSRRITDPMSGRNLSSSEQKRIKDQLAINGYYL